MGWKPLNAALAIRGAGWMRKVTHALGRRAEQFPKLVEALEGLLGWCFGSRAQAALFWRAFL
ncbi:MAG: hypothetical protein N838_27125 [Thiohalocapsa sp. PB-PSB1]|jgi:hypothetical protein|nr:MAG: hypothetical protein N838_32725 [Thiohalocapsa sp. PB-PSB1]QQO56489.1 MAG: hypothetical protein N838_27125 [Thiohalocapsa sp. PB-PSB1]HCS88653.1 hypothetical protein [Chromatiaceae bacterium]